MAPRLCVLLLLSPLVAFAAAPADEFAPPALEADAILQLPAIDAAKALREDAARRKQAPGPVRYALGHAIDAVALDGAKSRGGQWSTLPDGRELWRLQLHAPEASSIDLGFSKFRLPHGAELRVRNPKTGEQQGPFTDADNPPGGEFWTPILRGDMAELELLVPAGKRAFLQLTLDTVHHGYKDLVGSLAGPKSGSCNVDVVCPEGDNWRDEIRSAAVVAYNASGTREGNGCSGQFVNSTAPTAGPLFLSAGHCGIEAASARVYFNFQNSVCRAPGSVASGQNGDGPLNVSLFGAVDLARSNTPVNNQIISSDFNVLRFNNQAPGAANLYLSGWDRRDLAPSAVTGIHHPAGDEKRISFENNPLSITAYSGLAGSGVTHLRVADWDLGTTEQGSSGSGIWTNEGRVVGVLSGGDAFCGNNEADWYGRLAHAWEGLGAPSSRLKDWLDNGNTGAQTLDGKNACALNVTLDSAAFSNAPAAGATVTFTAAAAGASGAVSYDWDVDGDGVSDRRSTSNTISITYPTAFSTQVQVTATDANQCGGIASRALDVVAPSLNATAGAATQVCGDGDAAIEPGERWNLPVTLRNNGGAALPAGARALFVPGSTAGATLPIGPNAFGYRATTAGAACGYSFIDIASGANAVAALAVVNPNSGSDVRDDVRTQSAIALGGNGIRLYGQSYTQAVMSSNGYVSLSSTDTGGDYTNDCAGGYNLGAAGPHLRPQHDDLVIGLATDGGLRYRYFPTCPRAAESDAAAQPCHVFQWSRMQLYVEGGPASGDFEFQAIAYERSGQVTYQYRSAAPNAGATATIGVSNFAGNDPLNVQCNGVNAAPAQSAICVFDPTALPAAADPGLRLESPALALPALATAAQSVVNVPIALRTDATCGAPLAVDYFGTAASGSSSVNGATVLQTTVGGGGACQVSNACAAQIANVPVRNGIYSTPGRGGNGLTHYVFGNVYGGAWYTALPDRTPTWYLAVGSYADNLARATLTQVRNSAAPNGLTPVNTPVGQAFAAQLDNDSLVYAWNFLDGSRGIELMDASGLPAATPNYTQVWRNTGESGWGLAIESLQTGVSPTDQLTFIGAYVYDSSGVARWLTGSRSAAFANGNYPLAAYRVHCPACPWFTDWNAPLAAGSLNLSFTSATTATLGTTITLPAPLSGSWNRSNVPLQPFATPAVQE
jgi:lysyl endopeptidase